MTKMSPGTLLLGVFAVLFGLIGAYAVKQHLRQEPPEEAVAAEAKPIVPLATIDLPPGRTLAFGDVMIVKMTYEQMEQKGIPLHHMTDPRQLIGRTLREPVKRGEAFVTTAFYPEGIGPSVAARLKPGYRAITIALEDLATEAGLVSPGAVVDVMLRTFANEGEQLPETTVTLLDAVEVLAIGPETFEGARTQPGRNARSRAAITVTLAVTPKQASALKVVEGRGTLSLTLRNPEEEPVAAHHPAPQTLVALLGLPEPQKPFVTEVYRRGRLTTATFSEGRRTSMEEAFRGLPVGLSGEPTATSPMASILATRNTPVQPEPCGCEDE